MGSILTPITLWENFDSELPLNESIIKEFKHDGIKYTEIYFSGRQVEDLRVRIYAVFAKLDDEVERPSILILPDCDKTVDLEVITLSVKKGYQVLMIDYCGETENRERFTKYPQSVFYGNYYKAGRYYNFVESSAKETSWYEWVAVARYSIKYLSKVKKATKIGVMGPRQGGNLVWQLLATENGISCGISLFGLGWEAYRGINKYDNDTEIAMDSERHRFIGAIDAHAYAPYIKSPILLLTSTNDSKFDADRAFDTLARIKPSVDYIGNFSIKYDGFLGMNSLNNIDVFFNKYLNNIDIALPSHLEVGISYEKGECLACIKLTNNKDIDDYELYYSEGTLNPSLRDWILVEEKTKSNDKLLYKLDIAITSKIVFVIAKAKYKSGFTISSKIVALEIENKENGSYAKSRIIYTSKNNQDCFTVIKPSNLIGEIFFETGEKPIDFIKGPFNIKGIYSKFGLKTYRIGSKRYRAEENAVLKFDIYTEFYGKITVGIKTECFTDNEKMYISDVNLYGGEVWQSVQLNASDFKTSSGNALKAFSNGEVLSFECSSKYAINNIIWL